MKNTLFSLFLILSCAATFGQSSTILPSSSELKTNTDTTPLTVKNTLASSTSTTLKIESNGEFDGIGMVHTGTGDAINGYKTSNTGNAGYFKITNSANPANAIYAETNGASSGNALYSRNIGLGRAGYFQIFNTANASHSLFAETNGTGRAANFSITNSANSSDALFVQTNGLGRGGFFQITNNANSNAAVGATTNGGGRAFYGINTGNGLGAHFQINNATNSSSALISETNGTGRAGTFQTTNTAGTGTTLYASTQGTGRAGEFRVENTTSGADALQVVHSGFGNAIYALQAGSSNANAGYFRNTNNSNLEAALKVDADHKGEAASFNGNNTTSISPVVRISNSTVADGLSIANTNAGNFGLGIRVVTSDVGGGGLFSNFTASNASNVLTARTDGSGNAIYGLANSTNGEAGLFQVNNTSNNSVALKGQSNGNSSSFAIHGLATGQGVGGVFQIDNPTNPNFALTATTNGSGNAFMANYGGSGASTTAFNNIAIFRNNGNNVARIDNTGKGFFNNGTQLGGADVAESFEVEGAKNTYETGDVLVISTSSDRKVEKSSEAYSSLVAGVYATKPGVLLTPESIDTDISHQVPMGVIGVIPTKVCNEGGAIKRGDLLVTSSKSGYAMKADRSKLQIGQAIGKALQDFDGTEGKIEVLVSIR